MTALGDLLGRLDPEKVRRGRQFARICQWFLTHDPVYVHELRRVWLWDDWPGRWGADAGIDLVAEDHKGHLWAIQAKAYNAAYWVTKHDVDTFLSESGRPEFSFRLLIATTDRIGRTAKRTIEAQEKQASVLLLGDLEAAEVEWPASPSDLRAPQLSPRRPEGRWAYQGEAMNAVVAGFDQSDRGQLIMACGTGKTLTALFITERLAAERTLVLVPSLSLLAQTLREWTANTKAGFDFLPVCSDETVAEPDAVVANTSDLGFPVTTDAEEIAAFLRRRSGPRVVFATYQSSPQIAKAFRLGRVPAFDLAIADEAHRCAGRASSDFATILESEAIRARRRLFMTATPRYFTGRVVKEAKEADFEVASMDDEEKFGPVFHRLAFAEAIEGDLLTDYRVVVVGVDDATYRDWAQRGRFVTIDGTEVTDARTLAGQIGLAKAMRRYDLHRTITFHSRVKRAREFARDLPQVIAWMPARQRPTGHLWSDYASGEMPAGQRHVLLRHLGKLEQGQRGLLANARCLAEGVDVPTLDGVAFIDPRRSEVDIVQAVGRAIRLAPDKTVGTIVIPVFIDTDQDPEIALDDSAFKPVWDVIQALRSHDEELAEQLNEFRRQLGRGQRQRLRLPAKIAVDMPASVGVEFARAFEVRLVEQTTLSWEFWFGVLEQFVGSHGHARVAGSYTVDGYRLGRWVIKQRTKYDKGILPADRQHRLQDLPDWTWDPKADQWEDGFSRLLHYVEIHGDAHVPAPYTVGRYRLGRWVIKQRAKHAEGVLRADRQRRLDELRGWTWDTSAGKWEEGYTRLLEYVELHDHARVPASYTIDGYPLGNWVGSQRANYRKGVLDVNRQRRLQGVQGWAWDAVADQWEDGFSRLLRYVKDKGDARVPQSYKVDGYRLGTWVNSQRANFRKGILDSDRQRRLEDLPRWTWDPRADWWEEGFNRLTEYIERQGNARVPQPYKADGYPLGAWINTQRAAYRDGVLEADRQRRLQELPRWTWEFAVDQWEEGFSQLLHYVESNGDARVPRSYKIDGFTLGQWVVTQRQKRAKRTLDADRERRLEDLSGWIWDTPSHRWEEGFERLQDYVERHNHARVPVSYTVDHYPLGRWVSKQRVTYSRGTLEADRERRLEEMPRWTWDPFADQWEEGFSQLLHYVESNGDARVPRKYSIDGYQLGDWVTTQRQKHAKGTLDADREQRLQDMPGWTWNPSSLT